MNKIAATFLVLPLLGGCRALSSAQVPSPPSYENGLPTEDYYESLAFRTEELAAQGSIPEDPHAAYRLALATIEEKGVQLLPKGSSGFEQWDGFTTTYPTVILLSPDWEEKTEAERAVILWHEIVHLREYGTHGELRMGLMYLTSEGRWALEVQAYRESFRVLRGFGEPEEKIRQRMKPRAEKLYESYSLGTMPRDYAVNKAVEIWMLDSR